MGFFGSRDGNMTAKRKHDNQSFANSDELFESIYRKELDAFLKDKAKKSEHRKTAQASSNQKYKPASDFGAQKPTKQKPGGQKKGHMVFEDKTQRVEKPVKRSKTVKVGLLLVLLAGLGGIFFYSQGLIDINFLKPIQEPKKKKIIQRPVSTEHKGEADEKRALSETAESSGHTNTPAAAKAPEEKPAQAPYDQTREEQSITGREKAEHETRAVKSELTLEQPGEVRLTYSAESAKFLKDQKRVSYPYSIYLGSYKTQNRARKAISIYEQKGLTPYWVKVDLGAKGEWFRVFAGCFKDKKDAELFINKNQLPEAETRHTKYANLIGVYESIEDLEKKKQILTELGYYSYVIKGVNDGFFLYAGAFYQKSRAEEEQKHLTSKGIESRVVER
jgi:hypothetical protein